jgi:general secretion pathway protein C
MWARAAVGVVLVGCAADAGPRAGAAAPAPVVTVAVAPAAPASGAAPEPLPAPASTPAPPPTDTASITAAIVADIRVISPTERTITTRARELSLEHFARVTAKVRAIPVLQSGASVGVRLFGVRPDEVVGALGFENGDQLLRLNGTSVASPDMALEAYARSRDKDLLTFEIVRRGAPAQLLLRVVD